MTVERGGVGGIVNPLEIRETALDIGQIAFLLGTYCVRLKGDAETLEEKKNRLINRITGKRSTKDDDVNSNAFHYNTPANSPIDCYFNSSDATKVALKYEVGCRLWDFSNLKMSGDGESALYKIKTDLTDELNGNLKKIMKQEQIDILESADSIDASIYAMNVHTGAYSEHPKEGIKWADIIFAAGVAGNMADDEYSAANGTGEGIKEENKDLYNGILRFRKASEYLDKGNPGQNQDAYVIEKWDGEKWVAMKWVSKEDMKKIENEYSKRTEKYKKPNPKPDPKDDTKDQNPEQNQDDTKGTLEGEETNQEPTPITENKSETEVISFIEEKLDNLGIDSTSLASAEYNHPSTKGSNYDIYNTTSGAQINVFKNPSKATTTSGAINKAITIKIPNRNTEKAKKFPYEVFQYTINEDGNYEQAGHFYQ